VSESVRREQVRGSVCVREGAGAMPRRTSPLRLRAHAAREREMLAAMPYSARHDFAERAVPPATRARLLFARRLPRRRQLSSFRRQEKELRLPDAAHAQPPTRSMPYQQNAQSCSRRQA